MSSAAREHTNRPDRNSSENNAAPPTKQARLADVVAAQLRNRILAGDYGETGSFPRQAELVEEFAVSAPSIREALRVLEAEGLISVQRGRDGGAVVHRPRREKIAYMLGMVLQSEEVVVADVLRALRRFDPLCIGACAARRDRNKTVVPVLRKNLELCRSLLEDAPAFQAAAGRFHHECVQHSGNQTTIILVSSLETVVGSQLDRLASETDYFATFGDLATRKISLSEHEAIVDAIADGDEQAAEALAREHYSEAHWETPESPQKHIVDSNLL